MSIEEIAAVDRVKIAGWSPYRRTGGVTGHILSMSEIASEYYGLNVDLRADHFGPRPIERYIWEFRRMEPLSYDEDFYSCPDYPDYQGRVMQYMSLYRGKFKENGETYSLGERLNVIRPVASADESVFSKGKGDVCFVDSSGGNSLYSFRALSEADLIIAFLPDDYMEIRKFFNLYSLYLHKIYCIVNRFSEDDDYFKKLFEEYHVAQERTGYIPFCKDFERACFEQRLDQFIKEEIVQKDRGTYVSKIKNITGQVLKEARHIAAAKNGADMR